MKAEDVRVTDLLQGAKQFIVPVFQRDYSWKAKQCIQLWSDIMRVGADHAAKWHFVGSVVYVAAEESSANITRWLLIDGQQRLTTATLLITALRNRLQDEPAEGSDDADDDRPTAAELDDYYLFNRHAKGDRRYRLHLRRSDRDTLTALLDRKPLPIGAAPQLVANYNFFVDQLETADLETVYGGLKKLVAVDVSLTRGQDDPQMIFESLNSTGLDLTQADLIRNFVLMRQEEEQQQNSTMISGV